MPLDGVPAFAGELVTHYELPSSSRVSQLRLAGSAESMPSMAPSKVRQQTEDLRSVAVGYGIGIKVNRRQFQS